MIALQALSESPEKPPADDYDTVRRAIEFVSTRWRAQPSLGDIAAAASVSENQLHALFRRWAGITPKAFLQAITLDAAKRLLDDEASLLDCAYEVGLSGPSRLHDLFVAHEAMSPGAYKSGADGLDLRYGFHDSPFGTALVVATDRGLAGLGWVGEASSPGTARDTGKAAGGRDGAFADMTRRWPRARWHHDPSVTHPIANRIFDPRLWRADQPLRIVMIGSDFEVRVWEALLAIPMGRASTYGAVASRLGSPGSARAVGAAVGRNPISFVVPCHRVIAKSGSLTGYHWGLTRKQAILGWEQGHLTRRD